MVALHQAPRPLSGLQVCLLQRLSPRLQIVHPKEALPPPRILHTSAFEPLHAEHVPRTAATLPCLILQDDVHAPAC